MITLKKNDEYIAEITGYTSEALGVCHIDSLAVFVPKTIKGEIWKIRIVKVTNSANYAIPLELMNRAETSSRRTTPSCAVFGKCGGCDTCHMSYQEELDMKLSRVNDALHHIGHQDILCKEIIAADHPDHY